MTSSSDRASPTLSVVPGGAPAPQLLDQLRDHLRTRHYRIHTETAYVDGARPFILFHGKRHQLSFLQCCAASVAQRFLVGRALLQGRAFPFGLRV